LLPKFQRRFSLTEMDYSAFVPPLQRQPPPTVYHYTTREGLLGITETRALWVSNIRYLNDSREFTAATEIALSVLESLISAVVDAEEKSALVEFRPWLTSLNDQAQSYVFSFSEDGDLLSQWRGYSKPSDGYAIGFDTTALTKLSEQQGFFFRPCEYAEEAQRDLIERFFRAGLARLHASLKTVGPVPARQTFAVFCVLSFLHVAPLVKNHKFKEELEWRLVAPIHGALSPNLSFRSGKSMLIPYLPFSLGGNKPPIVEVVIGPSPHGPLDSMAVLNMLGLRDAVATSCRWSAIPFRDW